ncbi:MAG: hypothetical protein WBR26_06200 [Candidatus Acidiferrum sp.]
MNFAAGLPIKNDMEDGTPEPRTPVMIMVEVSWQDQSGTMQTGQARIENKSTGGACIRLNRRVDVGTKLRIEGKWEKFSGEARYCRKDGRDYLVGIQKDQTVWPDPTRVVGTVVGRGDKRTEMSAIPDVEALMDRSRAREQRVLPDGHETRQERVTLVGTTDLESVGTVVEQEGRPERYKMETKKTPLAHRLDGIAMQKQQIREPVREKAGKRGKHMLRKWFDGGHKEESQENLSEIANQVEEEVGSMAVTVTPKGAVATEPGEVHAANAQLELLPMEDVYRMAGILNPRKGYSINKVVDMLHSEHLRGLSQEMKRASVLMALDAAGITVEEVLEDAKARQDAIDSYEAEQRKQFEAQLARKAEENTQIQAELERVKARYTERLRRNLDGMAREKATFGNWLTTKQQEAQSMTEAVDLYLKPSPPEKPSTPLEEVSLAGTRVKPV